MLRPEQTFSGQPSICRMPPSGTSCVMANRFSLAHEAALRVPSLPNHWLDLVDPPFDDRRWMIGKFLRILCSHFFP